VDIGEDEIDCNYIAVDDPTAANPRPTKKVAPYDPFTIKSGGDWNWVPAAGAAGGGGTAKKGKGKGK